jgi:hypothetical protein
MGIGPKKTFSMLVIIVLAEMLTLGGVQPLSFSITGCVLAFIFGLILTPLLQFNTLYYRLIIEKPRWSDKFDQRKPLIFIQYLAYMIVAAGFGEIIGGFFDKQFFNFIGLILFISGNGVLAGMHLTLALKKSKINLQKPDAPNDDI